MSASLRCRFQLLGAALLFSTGGAAIKAAHFTSWQVACFRSGVAAATVLLFLPGSRRIWNWRVALTAVAYALTLISFVTANKLTTSANAIYLQSAAPLFLVLLGPWLLHERVRRSDLFALAALFLGLVLIMTGAQSASSTAPNPALGNWIAAASSLTWALTIAGLRWMETTAPDENGGMATVAAGNLLAFLLCLPMSLPAGVATPADWLCILYLGVFQIGLAYALLTRGIRGVPALESSLVMMVEPAINPVWAFFLHGERPAQAAVAGGLLILAATAARMLARPSP